MGAHPNEILEPLGSLINHECTTFFKKSGSHFNILGAKKVARRNTHTEDLGATVKKFGHNGDLLSGICATLLYVLPDKYIGRIPN